MWYKLWGIPLAMLTCLLVRGALYSETFGQQYFVFLFWFCYNLELDQLDKGSTNMVPNWGEVQLINVSTKKLVNKQNMDPFNVLISF